MKMNENIRVYITTSGLKFTRVAEKSGFNMKKFSRFMTNKQPMTTDEYERICREGLGVDPTFFYKNNFLDSKNKSA
ncbi:helix-turn-helix domain-containing protein [Paenibacillus taiwanensis]|uniref:helix-turn-helix domain-containing protein n=1 Tax=Paenibacillus taiwanensis TaxID=401638 RepID=UPI00048FD5AD|nr:helix-turn-helix domain-containing protein [Paenibacillus taiwanensis]